MSLLFLGADGVVNVIAVELTDVVTNAYSAWSDADGLEAGGL